MTLSLSEPIASYFAAAIAGDASALARCFTEEGVVRDEGETFKGIAAIQQWHTRAKEKYHYIVEPLTVSAQDGEIVVVGRLTGDFPGSPITLQHVFRVEGHKIVSLDIR